jgi:hypothetical protein
MSTVLFMMLSCLGLWMLLKSLDYSGLQFSFNLVLLIIYTTMSTVDAQFLIGDMTRLLDSWFECSECEYLHNEEDNRIEERPGVSRGGHSDA